MAILGYNTIGESTANNADWKLINAVNTRATRSGTAFRVAIYTPAGTAATNRCKLAVYAGISSGSTLITQVEIINAAAGQWNYATVDFPIVEGNIYSIAYVSNGTHGINFAAGQGYFYSPGTGSSSYSTEMSSTLTPGGGAAASISMFIEYNETTTVNKLGYTNIGIVNSSQSNWKLLQGHAVTPSVSGTLSRIYVFAASDTPTTNQCKLGIYAGTSSSSALLASATLTNATPGQWNYVTVNLSVTAGTPVYIAMMQNGTHGVNFDNGGASGSWLAALPERGQTYANELLNPLGQSTEARTQLLSLYAEYETAATTYTLTVNNDGNGTTTPSGAQTVNSGANTSISATASNGYSFVNWTVTSGSATFANANSASTTVSITANATIRANFTAIPTYTLTVSNDGNGTTNPSGAQTVESGSSTSIAATASSGYRFVNWTVTAGSATIANANNASTTVSITVNATVRANFEVIPSNTNKILCIGDSNTYGHPDPSVGGYRKPLQDLLGKGVFDFVGQYTDAITGTGYDGDHAGHSGDITSQIAARLSSNLTTYMVNLGTRSYVLLPSGTNDVYQDSNTSNYPAVVTAISNMIDVITAYNSSIIIICATVLPIQNTVEHARVVVFNGLLNTMLSTKMSTNPNLRVADLYGRVTANTQWSSEWMYDNLHPNALGFSAMAVEWFDAIYGGAFTAYRINSDLQTDMLSDLLARLNYGSTNTNLIVRVMDSNYVTLAQHSSSQFTQSSTVLSSTIQNATSINSGTPHHIEILNRDATFVYAARIGTDGPVINSGNPITAGQTVSFQGGVIQIQIPLVE